MDLLANGERRIRDRQFEDAILRAYRILELVGQSSLFALGYDSGAIPPSDPTVMAFIEKQNKNGRHTPSEPKVEYQFPREMTAHFLKCLGSKDLGNRLLNFDKSHSDMNAKARNYSILIHGFTAVARDEEALRCLFDDLKKLVIDHGGDEAAANLDLARFADFSAGAR